MDPIFLAKISNDLIVGIVYCYLLYDFVRRVVFELILSRIHDKSAWRYEPWGRGAPKEQELFAFSRLFRKIWVDEMRRQPKFSINNGEIVDFVRNIMQAVPIVIHSPVGYLIDDLRRAGDNKKWNDDILGMKLSRRVQSLLLPDLPKGEKFVEKMNFSLKTTMREKSLLPVEGDSRIEGSVSSDEFCNEIADVAHSLRDIALRSEDEIRSKRLESIAMMLEGEAAI
jgi:hypothetical protein